MSLPTIIAERGISTAVFSALKNSIFPGAKDESVAMAWDYCTARGLDVMLKPVHLVPMSVKDAQTGKYDWRDVVMPGIGLYRIQADRAGNYAGMSAPTYGPDVTVELSGVTITYPEWCEMTVSKLIGDRIVNFTDRQYWLENYATAGKDSQAPNAMWKKRPRAQIAKCTEAQVLRKAWPELGSQPTAEEMEGKDIIHERDITAKGETLRDAAPVEYITTEQAEEIRELIKNYDGNETLFCQGASIGCVEELKAHRFEGAKRNLERKIARMIAAEQAKSEQQGAA